MNAILHRFSELQLCVLNATPFENRWWRFTANHGTGFTDEMRMTIACDISPSPIYITYVLVNLSISGLLAFGDLILKRETFGFDLLQRCVFLHDYRWFQDVRRGSTSTAIEYSQNESFILDSNKISVECSWDENGVQIKINAHITAANFPEGTCKTNPSVRLVWHICG